MKNFSGVCQAAGADKPLRAFFIWITNIVTFFVYLPKSVVYETDRPRLCPVVRCAFVARPIVAYPFPRLA